MTFGQIDDDFEANISGESNADFFEPLQGNGEIDGEDTIEISSALEDFDVTPQELRDQHRRKTGTVLEWSDEDSEDADL